MIDKDIADLVGENAAARLAAVPLRDLYRRDILKEARLTEKQMLMLKAALSIGRRHLVAEEEGAYEGKPMSCPDDVFSYMRPRLMHLDQEELHVLLLNTRNGLMSSRMVTRGSLNQSFAGPREVIGLALREAAAAIVMVHNHPSGDPQPSREDIDITQANVVVAKYAGIRLLDHLIVAGSRFYSMNREGHL